MEAKRISCHCTSTDCKAEARHAILGHLGIAVGSGVTYLLVLILLELLLQGALPSSGTAALVLSELMSILISIIAGIYQYGLICVNMKLQYGQSASLSDLFLGLRENQNKIVRIMSFLAAVQVLCLLPSILADFLLPQNDLLYWSLAAAGLLIWLYWDLTYYPALYLLLDYPNLSARAVLQKSRSLMKGQKRRLLYLELSFLPLWILALCSFGVAGLWVYAYSNAALAAFYRKLMNS